MCQVTLTTPLEGMTCRQQAGLAAINIQIKFEVSNYTHYEAVQNREFGVVRGH